MILKRAKDLFPRPCLTQTNKIQDTSWGMQSGYLYNHVLICFSGEHYTENAQYQATFFSWKFC